MRAKLVRSLALTHTLRSLAHPGMSSKTNQKNDSQRMTKFLNRILGLHVNAQDVMMAMVLDILAQVGIWFVNPSIH